MQEDFHYYATYCAATLAGYEHEESLEIAYSAQMVDCCSETFLKKVKGPHSAATTQSKAVLMNAGSDIISIQNMTRIWASFHFLPGDLYARIPGRPRHYLNKYRLICLPNGDLLEDTVNLAKDKGPRAAGVAMHILADTWAHSYFAGTPSLVINNTDQHFWEILKEDGQDVERKISFKHNPASFDDPGKGTYINSLPQSDENSVMNLGHGRAGHLPDYSFIRYRYIPAWDNYNIVTKDNPSDYYKAFCQMVYALGFLRGDIPEFKKCIYEEQKTAPYRERIMDILEKRQLNASLQWKEFGESLSGCEIEDFDIGKYQEEYINAPKGMKDDTFLGSFFLSAMAQKSMVTNKIFKSGSLLAGFSVDYRIAGFKGIKDFKVLIENSVRNIKPPTHTKER